MSLPLIITNGDGDIEYLSSGMNITDALHAWLSAVSKNESCGRISCGRKNFFVKKLLLAGKRYYVFMDYDMLISCFGVDADRFAGHLFSIEKEEPRQYSLKVLTFIFLETYYKSLRADGIKVTAHDLLTDMGVYVPPRAFALALTLIIKLCAENGSDVGLRFLNKRGRVTVFADSMGENYVKTEARDILRILLFEISNAAGFSAHEYLKGGKLHYSLELTPSIDTPIELRSPGFDPFAAFLDFYLRLL